MRPNSNKDRGIREQRMHLLERNLFRFWKKGPEKDSVGNVANNKRQIILPSSLFKSDGRDLSNHGVERERGHGSQTHALSSCMRIKHLCWYDP